MSKKLLTIREASEILGVATSRLRRWEEEDINYQHFFLVRDYMEQEVKKIKS